MADIAKTVEIIFSGIDNVSSITSGVGKEIENLGGNIGDIAAPFEEATKAVLTFEAALAALVAGGLVIAFNASKEFENSVIELNKVLADNENSDEAIQNAKDLSDTYGESSSTILESIANFKQAGFDLAEAMGLSKDAMDLVIAGGLEADQASALLVATLKGFKAEASDATRIIDILNETSNNYATDVENLASGMARVSPIANQMGFTMEETAGLLTPIIEVFRSGDEAANALRTGLLQLTNDTKPVVETLDILGVSQKDANGNFRTGKEIFLDVAKAMSNMDEAQRGFYTQQLVGIEQAPKMSILFSDLGKVTEITATAMGSAGSAAKEVALRLDSSEVSVKRFQTAWTNTAIAIGDKFRDSTKEAINGATDIENAIRGLVDGGIFDQILDYVNAFANELSFNLGNIANNLPEAFENIDFDSLLDGLDNLKTAFGGVFNNVDLSTPEGLAEVIQVVVDALGGLQNTAAGIIEFLTPITDAIGSMVKSFSELSPETQTLIGQIAGLGTALGGLATLLAAGGALLAGIGALGTALLGPVGVVVGIGALSAGILKAIDSLSKWASNKFNSDLEESTKLLELQNKQVEGLLEQLNDVAWDDPKRIEIETAIDNGDFLKAQLLIDEAVAEEHEIKVKAIAEQEEFDEVYQKLQKLGNLDGEEISILAKAEGVDEIENAITEITKKRSLEIDVKADTKTATETLTYWTEENGTIEIEVPVEAKNVEETKKKIEEIPTEKQIEITLQGEIDKQIEIIKTNAKTVQTAFEWKAKLDIAEAEANTKQIESAFTSINTQVENTAAILSAAFEGAESSSYQARREAIELLQTEQEIMKQNSELQKKLVEEQIKYLDARTEALNSGDVAINITSDGLEPSLELVMWEILKKVQVKATEESADFLLGVG